MLFLNLIACPCACAADCLVSGEETVTLATVERRLELRLTDGRTLRLVGLDPERQTPTDPDAGATARSRLAALIDGKPLSVRILSSLPDRWGRLAAEAWTADGAGAAPGGLAAAALALGLGRYLVEPAAHPCRQVFLAAEKKARAAKVGLWADPYYAVLAVDDQPAFIELSGTVVLTEGRLTAVVPGPYRTKLHFATEERGHSRGSVLAATIVPHDMKTFAVANMDFNTLVGRTLRMRGLLDLRFGPRIELTSPDQVEEMMPQALDAKQPN